MTLLTKEHLIKEGWKVDKRYDHAFYRENEVGELLIGDDFLDVTNETAAYNGPIPTLEQWEVLKELLNIQIHNS